MFNVQTWCTLKGICDMKFMFIYLHINALTIKKKCTMTPINFQLIFMGIFFTGEAFFFLNRKSIRHVWIWWEHIELTVGSYIIFFDCIMKKISIEFSSVCLLLSVKMWIALHFSLNLRLQLSSHESSLCVCNFLKDEIFIFIKFHSHPTFVTSFQWTTVNFFLEFFFFFLNFIYSKKKNFTWELEHEDWDLVRRDN